MDETMCEVKFLPDGVTARVAAGTPITAVSYTHLTLPTTERV